ncbi:NINE protein [Aliiroseovarius sp. 2305UL8-7]|uniref:NINE protein n=1 Tax=Aliiroseovarius conchicola TaxID=3121637 RepID=UPI003527C400
MTDNSKTIKPNLVIAYLLLLIVGWFGTHRFYLGEIKVAKIFLWVTLISLPLLFLGGIGAFGLYAVFFGMIVDLFMCPSSYKVGHHSGLSIGGSGSFV